MKILIINCFPDTKSGHESFKIIQRHIRWCIGNCRMINGQESPEIIVKRTNELYDYIVDWEYSILVPTARTQTILFDKIDIIYLAGDTKIMPWEPSCFDLIILLHIFHLMNKPVLSLGGGAFAAIYASATQGVRFHMINGKIGGSLEQLPYQTTYFKGSNAVRCGWLENETGDVYSFDRSSTSWVPTFNTGIYRNALTGAPTPSRFRPTSKVFSREKTAASQLPQPTQDHESVIHIRNDALHHFAFRNIEMLSFVGTLLPDWYLNQDGALPLQDGYRVLADGPYGPAILGDSVSIHIILELNDSHSSQTIRDMVKNFTEYTFKEITTSGHSGRNLTKFLFDGNVSYESVKISKDFAKPLSTLPIRSKLKDGPEKIDNPIPEHRISYASNHHAKHVKNPPVPIVQDPEMGRRKRIELFLKESGQQRMMAVQKMADYIHEDVLDIGAPSEMYYAYNDTTQGDDEEGPKNGSLSAREPMVEKQVDYSRPKSASNATNRYNWTNNWEEVRAPSSNLARPPSSGGRKTPQDGNSSSEYNMNVYAPNPPAPADNNTSHNFVISRMLEKIQSNHLPVHHPSVPKNQPKATVYVNPKPERKVVPAFKKVEKIKENLHTAKYEGAYRGVYLSSFEREVKEYNDSKKQFLHGDFKRHVGPASALTIRQPGCVRPHGAYPAIGKYHKDKPNPIGGAWKPLKL